MKVIWEKMRRIYHRIIAQLFAVKVNLIALLHFAAQHITSLFRRAGSNVYGIASCYQRITFISNLTQWYKLKRARRQRASFIMSHTTQLVIWLIGILIFLLVFGMGLLSRLNLNYSQDALQKLRQEQIQDVVYAGLYRIDTYQMDLERNMKRLASVGEIFYKLNDNRSTDSASVVDLQKQLTVAVDQFLKNSSGISSAGVWFEPGVLAGKGNTFAVEFNQMKAGEKFFPAKLSKNTNYRDLRWFEMTYGKNPKQDFLKKESKVRWSPVYFDFVTERAIFTLALPMYNSQNKLIGVVTTNWPSDQIVKLVSNVKITENSFAFLNDRNNRNLSSLSLIGNAQLEQDIIDGILAENLSGSSEKIDGDNGSKASSSTAEQTKPAIKQEVNFAGRPALQHRSLIIDNDIYEIYFATTSVGMVYGALVPRLEIDQVLIPMRDANYRILIVTSIVLLIFGSFLLYRIILLIKELQASYTDALTHLPNRARLFKDAATLDKATLIIVNIDRFKEINSLFGSDCGDHVLIEVASSVREFVDAENKKKNVEIHVYRLAADEFAVLCSSLTEEAAGHLASQLITAIRSRPIHWLSQPLNLDVSIGIALQQSLEQPTLIDELLSHATIAVVQARQQMRQYLFYDHLQNIEKGFEKNLYWAKKLKQALENNTLLPHFQPIYDNHKKCITKYECLVRMLDDEKGVISAGQFIEVASKLRLNRDISRIMIEKSFLAFSDESCEFSINLSYADIIDVEILNLILGKLQNSNIGSRVVFEILESDGIDNYKDVLLFIEKVRPFGCKIAIDDFGTGYSNFSHLFELHVDLIKIDGSLIRNLAEDHTAFVVTQSIVQFAKTLGIKTVAEFVHNEAVQNKVLELDIDFSQGEYFHMAGPDLIR